MRSPLSEALAALGRALGKLGLRWYLFGAQAALLYGAARLTADIDVTVQLGDRETGPGARAREGGLPASRPRRRGLRGKNARSAAASSLSGMPVDIVLAGPGIEELFFKRRRRRRIEGVPVHVASPEDLVVMKVLAGRGKDEDDAVAILAAQPRLGLAG
jgi:hypothetical protein